MTDNRLTELCSRKTIKRDKCLRTVIHSVTSTRLLFKHRGCSLQVAREMTSLTTRGFNVLHCLLRAEETRHLSGFFAGVCWIDVPLGFCNQLVCFRSSMSWTSKMCLQSGRFLKYQMRLYAPSRQHQASYAVDTRFNFSVCKVTGAWNRRLTFVNAVIKTRGALRSTLTSLQALQAILSLSYISATCSLLLSGYVVSITDIAVYYLSRPVSWVMDPLKSALSLS
jgi:hypothetical protein